MAVKPSFLIWPHLPGRPASIKLIRQLAACPAILHPHQLHDEAKRLLHAIGDAMVAIDRRATQKAAKKAAGRTAGRGATVEGSQARKIEVAKPGKAAMAAEGARGQGVGGACQRDAKPKTAFPESPIVASYLY